MPSLRSYGHAPPKAYRNIKEVPESLSLWNRRLQCYICVPGEVVPCVWCRAAGCTYPARCRPLSVRRAEQTTVHGVDCLLRHVFGRSRAFSAHAEEDGGHHHERDDRADVQ